jgi:hypothetical protein
MTESIQTPDLMVIPELKSYIPRLNVLLRFAHVDAWKLTNGEREKLLDDLYFAMYNLRRNRADKVSDFSVAATPDGLRDAQRGLKKHLDQNMPRHEFPVKQTTLVLGTIPETQRFFYRFSSKDFSTAVYLSLAYLLFMSDLTPDDLRDCSNCGTCFVPKRKAPKETPSYCSRKCANVVMAREYRARKKKKTAKRKMKKPK